MSDEMDDLEKFCDAVSVTANAGKTSAAKKAAAQKFFERGRLSVKDAGGLRLSVYEPSLPKLKFLEGKDE